MRRPAPRIIIVTLVVVAAAAFGSFRQEYLKVPRVRVGDLRSRVATNLQLKIFAVGDTGTGEEAQLKVAQAMEAKCRAFGGVDAILLLGDNAYPAGFASVEDPQWQTKVEGPYGSPCLKQVPIYAVLGNHDYKGNPAAEIEYSLINPRWHMPNRFYSVDFGHLLRLVATDSNVTEFCFNAHHCGIDFLAESVASAATTWTFVMAHHPLRSSSDHGFAYRGGLLGMVLKPYLCSRIDVYLSGHSHHMEHLQPEGCRMDLFLVGSGGANLYAAEEHADDSRFVKSEFGFLALEIGEHLLKAQFINGDGKVVYSSEKKPIAAAAAN